MNYKKNISARLPLATYGEIESISKIIYHKTGVKLKTSTVVRVLVIYALRDIGKIINELTEDDYDED